MLVGAVNPIGGALVILAGSGLIALGTFLGQSERRVVAYRVGVFLLIVIGVGATWGLMQTGGFGGKSGHSIWWGVLAVLPILIGWSMGIWGPGSPRWVLVLGIVASLWYLALLGITLSFPGRGGGYLPGIVLGAIGMLTIGGCINRLRKWISAQQ